VALLTPLSLPEAQAIGRGFGLDVASVEALSLGSVNSNFRLVTTSGDRYFARIYEEQGVRGARAELRLLRGLHQQRVPVTLPLAYEDGGDVALVSGKAFSVYQWIDGVHLCNALVTPARAETLGETLARVHLATPVLGPLPAGRFDVDGVRARLAQLRRDTDRFDAVVTLLERKLDRYQGARNPDLPRGLVHGDLFRDNVLWDGDAIVALLDFESAAAGPFSYDIAVCLWSWCYTDGLRVDCARALVSGYERVRPLGPDERRDLPTEAALACVRFATTRIRDFSMRCPPGQDPVRDYRRFLKRLSDMEAGALGAVLS
jgi:homoserine kinase type II